MLVLPRILVASAARYGFPESQQKVITTKNAADTLGHSPIHVANAGKTTADRVIRGGRDCTQAAKCSVESAFRAYSIHRAARNGLEQQNAEP